MSWLVPDETDTSRGMLPNLQTTEQLLESQLASLEGKKYALQQLLIFAEERIKNIDEEIQKTKSLIAFSSIKAVSPEALGALSEEDLVAAEEVTKQREIEEKLESFFFNDTTTVDRIALYGHLLDYVANEPDQFQGTFVTRGFIDWMQKNHPEAHPDAIYRLLRMLSEADVIKKIGQGWGTRDRTAPAPREGKKTAGRTSAMYEITDRAQTLLDQLSAPTTHEGEKITLHVSTFV